MTVERSEYGDGRRPGDRMPPWVPRLLATIVLIIVGMFTAHHLLDRLSGLIRILLISLFLAVAIEPGVNLLARRGWRRGTATGVMFVSVVGSIALFIGLMIPLIVDQTSRFIDRMPEYVERVTAWLQSLGVDLSAERISEAVGGVDSGLGGLADDIAGTIFGVGQALINSILQLLTIGLFTFYMAAEGPKMRRAVCSLFEPRKQQEVLRAWEIAVDKTGGYFYSRALLAGACALVSWAVFAATGIPFALALALWVGLLSQFVPVFGTYLGGALPVLIAFIEGPVQGIVVLAFIILYQQVENFFLAPRITAKTMDLHPALAFGAAIAGGVLMGVPGALMALPVAATLQAFIRTYLERHEVVASELTAEDARAETQEKPSRWRPRWWPQRSTDADSEAGADD